MKDKAKNIGIKWVSMLLCLHMFYLVAGRSADLYDIFAPNSSKVAALSVESDLETDLPAQMDTPNEDSTPADPMPDQEKECSENLEITDYFFVGYGCLITDRFIYAHKQSIAMWVNSHPQTAISEIAPPPPKFS